MAGTFIQPPARKQQSILAFLTTLDFGVIIAEGNWPREKNAYIDWVSSMASPWVAINVVSREVHSTGLVRYFFSNRHVDTDIARFINDKLSQLDIKPKLEEMRLVATQRKKNHFRSLHLSSSKVTPEIQLGYELSIIISDKPKFVTN